MRRQFFLTILLLTAWYSFAQTMQGYEYWLDNDYNAKVAVSSNQPNVSFETDVSGLQSGLHYLNFRAQDVDGQWGGLSRYIVYLTADSPSSADVASMVAYEYWMDMDYSSRTQVTGSGVTSPLTLDVSNLQPGLHYFNFRAQDVDGQWGGLSRYIVYLTADSPSSADVAGIVAYEYWMDTDYSSRTQVTGSSVTSPLTLDVSNLQPGLHYFNFRAQDVDGQWGGLSRYIVYLTADSPGNTDMVAYEYWMDTDYSSRTQVTGSGVTSPLTLDVSNLQPGLHYFNFRAQDANGVWGALSRYIVYLSDAPSTSNLVAVNYWIDENIDNVQRQQVSGNTIMISTDISNLEDGTHIFCLEGVDENGRRAILNTFEFGVGTEDAEPYAVVTGYETNGQTLTFYYDDQKENRGGMEIGPFAEYDNRPWGGDQQLITEVVFDTSFAGYTELTSTAYWFASIASLNTITGIENLKTDNVTNMREMFAGCMNLTSLDLSRFYTSNVADMQYMFAGCDNLTTIYVGNGWDVSKVTNSDEMFSGCFNLKGGAGTEFNQGQMGVTYAHVDGGENNPGYLTYLEDLDARKEELNMLIGEIYERLMVIKEMLEEKDPNRAATELWETLNQLEEEDVEISLSLEDAQTEADLDDIEWKIDELEERVSQLHEEVENYGLIAEVEPYAVLSDNNTVLTFYYDDQKAARNGMSVGPFNSDIERGWNEQDRNIISVIFDESFANCTLLTSTAWWFYDCIQLETIIGFNYLKTDNVTDMSQMFSWCTNLASIDVTGFNTSSVVDMSYMFGDCRNLTNINLNNFQTENVRNMSGMFAECLVLASLDLSHFNTANVTDMTRMFDRCYELSSLNISGFNTSNVTSMSGMFDLCSKLPSLDLSSFNTANVTDMSVMFYGCSSLTTLDISSFATEKLQSCGQMFYGCSSLSTIYVGSDWSTVAVENGDNMFTNCTNLIGGRGTVFTQEHTDVDYAHIDGGTANPGYLSSHEDFEAWKHELIERLNEIHIQIEEITAILQEKDPNQKATGLWQGLHFLNEDFITIHAVLEDAQTVTDLDDCEHKITELEDEVAHLFEEVVNYSENTDPIAYGVFTNNMMKLTFYYDTNMGTHNEGIVIPWEQLLNSNEMNNARQTLEIIDFDPSFVGFNTLTTTGYLFSGCMNLMAINGLEYLVTDNMTDMREMFASCESLTELDLRTFNTSRVTMMWGMFQGCIHLTTIIVGPGWTTAALTDEGHEMFAGCNSLVGGLGTTYSNEHFNADYAHIDGGPSNPGYLTGTEEPVITEFEVDGIFYRVHDQAEHRVTVAHVMHAEEELYVPFEVEYARIHWIVTALGEMAFTDLEQVKVIGVPESIDSVSVNLFNHCPHLAAIIWNANVPLTVTAMGQFNNPNLLLYIMNTANAPASVTNVIDMTTYMADKIVLSDAANGGNDFYCPEHFMAKEISYTHSYDQATQIGTCQGWESIVVPFDVQTYTHETKGEIYPISTLLDEQIELDGDKPFWLYAFTSNDEFVEAEQIRANTPYIISMPNDPAYWDDYILSGRVTFSAKGVEVYPTRNVISVESQSRVFVPNFENMDYENPDIFLLNVGDAYENHLPGSIFSGERPARRARPFEAYFIPTGNYPARYMDIFTSEVDAIREIPISSKTKEGIYDLMGRRVKSEEWRVEGNNSSTHQLQKGLYIIDGKKVMVK